MVTVEKYLFDKLTSNKTLALYKKYRSDSRDSEHVPSTGGLLTSDRDYYIYIAWGTKKSYGIER